VLEPENPSTEAKIGTHRKFLNLKLVLYGFGCLAWFVTEKKAGFGDDKRVKD
jgi:hypothetical protein